MSQVRHVLRSAPQISDDAHAVLHGNGRYGAACVEDAAESDQEEEIMTPLENAVSRSSDLRPRTKELYLQHVRAFLAYVGGTPDTFSDDDVLSWRKDMRRRKISPQSVNVALNALRYAAENAKLVKLADFARKRRLQISEEDASATKVDRALDWNEGRQLVGACEGTLGRDLRDHAFITLGLRTGMLRFSMCQLKISDLKGKNLTFVKKGGETHVIMLDDVSRIALETWVDWLREHGVKNGLMFRSLGRQRVDPRDGAAIGDQLTPDGLYRALRERARQAGLKDLHPHVFRKTFLAWAKEMGAQPGQIAAVTGHKSDAICENGEDKNVTTPPANMVLPEWTAKKLG
jgi:integrase